MSGAKNCHMWHSERPRFVRWQLVNSHYIGARIDNLFFIHRWNVPLVFIIPHWVRAQAHRVIASIKSIFDVTNRFSNRFERERNLNGTRDNRVSGNLIYRLRPDDANRNVNQFNLSCGWARCNGSVCYDPKIDIVNKVENEFIILRWKLRRIRSRRQSAQLHLQTRPTKLQLYLSEQKTIISSRENIKCNEKRSK